MTDNRTEAYKQRDSRMSDLAYLYRPYDFERTELIDFLRDDQGRNIDDEATDDEISDAIYSCQSECGLCFDKHYDEESGYVYYAFVLSTGGPHEEVRFYVDSEGDLRSSSFVSKPWFDLIEISMNGNDTMQAIFDSFDDCGMINGTVTGDEY
jgi:hypothetical protein